MMLIREYLDEYQNITRRQEAWVLPGPYLISLHHSTSLTRCELPDAYRCLPDITTTPRSTPRVATKCYQRVTSQAINYINWKTFTWSQGLGCICAAILESYPNQKILSMLLSTLASSPDCNKSVTSIFLVPIYLSILLTRNSVRYACTISSACTLRSCLALHTLGLALIMY